MSELKFVVKGDVQFHIQNLKSGNELNDTMPSGELVINGITVPFVLQRDKQKEVKHMLSEFATNLIVIHWDAKKTVFTKHGYVSLHFCNHLGQFFAYIKQEYLEELYSAVKPSPAG